MKHFIGLILFYVYFYIYCFIFNTSSNLKRYEHGEDSSVKHTMTAIISNSHGKKRTFSLSRFAFHSLFPIQNFLNHQKIRNTAIERFRIERVIIIFEQNKRN